MNIAELAYFSVICLQNMLHWFSSTEASKCGPGYGFKLCSVQ